MKFKNPRKDKLKKRLDVRLRNRLCNTPDFQSNYQLYNQLCNKLDSLDVQIGDQLDIELWLQLKRRYNQ